MRLEERSFAGTGRVWTIDALRGLLVVFMALDHASFFVAQKHSGEYWGGPFPAYRDGLTFLTRLVTHPCAPGFFFLMGTGMVLLADSWREKGWGRRDVIHHLVGRGVLLIVLKLLVVNRAWELSPTGWGVQTYIGVLFALGVDMVLGSALLWLKPAPLLVLTTAILALTDLLTPPPTAWYAPVSAWQRLLLIPGGDGGLWVNYPVVPWLALVTCGMAFGHWVAADWRKACERAGWIGLSCLSAFVLVRYAGGFGNIRPPQGSTWIDFLNVVKYPPSLVFILLTMGINLTVLGLLARAGGTGRRLLQPLATFGRAPLFFYVTHLFLYAAIGRLVAPHGTGIPQMYVYWLLGLLILYPLCLWYGRLRSRQPPDSILRCL